MLTTVAITTAVWVTATFATAPEPEGTLRAFYARVRPAGPGWRSIAARAGIAAAPAERLAPAFLNWLLGMVVVYAMLFALGEMLFGYPVQAALLGTAAIAAALILARRL
jgi:hypothetical protein